MARSLPPRRRLTSHPHYLATSGGLDVVPPEHALIVARTAEEWFEPEEQK
jgi:hypothetical protein